MSHKTREALDAAIAAHVADEYGDDMVTAWVVAAETTTLDMLDAGAGSMVVETREMQSHYLTTGLLYAALNADGGDDD